MPIIEAASIARRGIHFILLHTVRNRQREVAVAVVIRELDQGAGDNHVWPDGFFEDIAGAMPGLRRWLQGEFEECEPLG